jgi:DNA-binding IclR family transcriptional regulator
MGRLAVADRVQSVERALMLLEEVAASPVPPTAPEIAQRAGINRAPPGGC